LTSTPYPAAAKPLLAVPTPVVSDATTPEFDTKLVIETAEPVFPYPNIALSVPYVDAAKLFSSSTYSSKYLCLPHQNY
jgi:hypothetical protein